MIARHVSSSVLAIAVVAVAMATAACDRAPPAAQLEAWSKEAHDRNDAAVNAHKNAAGANAWSLTLSGQIRNHSMRLDWRRIDELSTVHVKTRAPHHTSNPQEIIEWRGMSVAALLDLAGADANAKTVTFIGADLFSVTVDIADMRKWPRTILATEQDGKPIKRSEAGPIVVVYPYSESPDVAARYDETYWAFYVSHVVVDHDDVGIRVGQRTLDRAALDKLPRVSVSGKMGFRIHWPSGNTSVRGVRLRDALAAAGVTVADGGKVIVRSKAPALPEDTHETKIDAADVKSCEILLALAWGEDNAPIPATMGGPVGLAFGNPCAPKYAGSPWPVYVEEIEIAAP